MRTALQIVLAVFLVTQSALQAEPPLPPLVHDTLPPLADRPLPVVVEHQRPFVLAGSIMPTITARPVEVLSWQNPAAVLPETPITTFARHAVTSGGTVTNRFVCRT